MHSVLRLASREAALGYPRGDVLLAACEHCGFIVNTAFDATVHEYSSQYEETQGYSPTYVAFAREQAQRLIDRHGLRGKTILEIGCGKGEFLGMLCELGPNRGVGFDPSYVEGRITPEAAERITFVTDLYSDQHAGIEADFICCRMALEHLPRPAELIRTVRAAIGDRYEVTVFFQVPDALRILRELAFWDIYYEHASYFTAASLARLFGAAAFEVLQVEATYGGQYLTIEARPAQTSSVPAFADDLPQLRQAVADFSQRTPVSIAEWKHKVEGFARNGRRLVLWGGGSKSVAFLTTLGIRSEVEYVVDINPHKWGTYLAGSGQEIVAPESLRQYRPGAVLVMNPIYLDEVRQELARLDLDPELLTL